MKMSSFEHKLMWCATARPGIALGPGMLQYLSNGGKHATPLKKSQHDGAERSPEVFNLFLNICRSVVFKYYLYMPIS